MKNGASVVLKQIIALLTSIAKTKSMAVKSKTSALKSRILMFSFLRSKKVLLHSISEKIHSILGQHGGEDEVGEQSKAVVVLHSEVEWSPSRTYQLVERAEDDDGKYPDLTHCLFEEEEEEVDMRGGSIIDMVKNGKEEEGEEFRLEDEIDHVADLFITRFHKQMRMQKLESFKRYQEMLQRGV
ncbi:uncharacterized protein LOC117923992 [Vitis riparia]|uniref:uncharacterized protein LOC117923992 n=1 Tax=Vitis riparia TaxID=96939 RepID=UPI00155B06FB|nr:uncharacterized protein LOC117923992 [Vitis riparia]